MPDEVNMTTENALSIADIQRETNAGRATVKFILKRFDKWLPHTIQNGLAYYDPSVVTTLLSIQEQLADGMLPTQIASALEAGDAPVAPPASTKAHEPRTGVHFSPDSLELITSLISQINTQQERIASAHEKRAAAEERKAVAIEKRALAEENKAVAMNNIAAALQEMTHSRNDATTRQLAGEAAAAIASDEISDDGLEDAFFESRVLSHNGDPGMDDDNALDDLDGLADLIDEPKNERQDSDVLSDLIKPDVFDPDSSDTDDLSDQFFNHDDIDDLSLLVDDTENQKPGPLDDLSLLIDADDGNEDMPLQDNDSAGPVEMDDLSMLIDDHGDDAPTESKPPMDDLSLLLGSDIEPVDLEPDDLEPESEDQKDEDREYIPITRPDISPQEDLAAYKKAVINIIVTLKQNGYSVEKTTRQFNDQGIQTLSGKDKWSEKAISQIYQFIEAAM